MCFRVIAISLIFIVAGHFSSWANPMQRRNVEATLPEFRIIANKASAKALTCLAGYTVEANLNLIPNSGFYGRNLTFHQMG